MRKLCSEQNVREATLVQSRAPWGQWFLCEILFWSYMGHMSIYWVILFNVFLNVSQSWSSNPECPADMITQDVYSLTERRKSQSGRRSRVWGSWCVYQKEVENQIENSLPVLERHPQSNHQIKADWNGQGSFLSCLEKEWMPHWSARTQITWKEQYRK